MTPVLTKLVFSESVTVRFAEKACVLGQIEILNELPYAPAQRAENTPIVAFADASTKVLEYSLSFLIKIWAPFAVALNVVAVFAARTTFKLFEYARKFAAENQYS